MRKLFILTLIFFLFTSVLLADDFYVDYDYIDSRIYVTPFLSVGEPVDSDYVIEVQEYEHVGLQDPLLDGNIFWQNHIIEVGGRNRRVVGVNDFVRIAPNTKVNLWVLINNQAGHDVLLQDWVVFLSHSEGTGRNWNNVGFVDAYTTGLTAFKFNGNMLTRRGNLLPLYTIEDIHVEKDAVNIVKIWEFPVIQAFEILDYQYSFSLNENGELLADVTTRVRNRLNGPIEGVVYIHGDFVSNRDFNSKDAFRYTYQINYGKDCKVGLNSFESFKLSVPSIKECAVKGSLLLDDNYDENSRTILVMRNDVGGIPPRFRRISDLDWYPDLDSMCIEVVPYSIRANHFDFHLSESVLDNLKVSFEKEVETDLALGDDLKLVVRIENTGDVVLNDMRIEIDYDDRFQGTAFSNCNFVNGYLHINRVEPWEVLFCSIDFEIKEREGLLKLNNTLLFHGSVKDQLLFTFLPDLEISLIYKQGFVFSSTYENSSWLLKEDFKFKNIPTCKRFSYLSLKREICTL